MIRATDIHSLTDFTRNAKSYILQIKETRSPMAITVNGDAEVVIQDAASYQQMVDELERSRFIAAVRRSENDAREGRVEDLDAAFSEIHRNLGL
jgi:PHD/YefM family antitoxin component YafN of YafNO toxin-antitoxin module